MLMLDANMILRYLLNDHPDMADTVERLLSRENVTVTIEVIAEVVYVLKRVYSLDRKTIASSVQHFLNLVTPKDEDVLKEAVKTYGNQNLDFVDCVLYAYSLHGGYEIATFDEKLKKLLKRTDSGE